MTTQTEDIKVIDQSELTSILMCDTQNNSLKPQDRLAISQKIKKLKEIGKTKQEKLMEDCRRRQAAYFGETQHKFLRTTNEHGA